MGKLFFGGVPTRMDVDKLMTIEAKPGGKVSYEEVGAVASLDVKSNRFRTVTDAWRKRLFAEHLLQTIAEGGSFHFLTADQAHDRGVKTVYRVGRQVGKLRLRVEAISAEALSEDRRGSYERLRTESGTMLTTMQASAKAIRPPLPISSVLRLG